MTARELGSGLTIDTEKSPVDPYTQALQDMYFGHSPEKAAEIRKRIWSSAQQVAANLIDPSQQAVVEIAAGIMEWGIFGRLGHELPKGTILTPDGVSRDTRLPYVNHTMNWLDSKIDSLGHVTETVRASIESREEKFEEAIVGIITSSAEYNFFLSFAAPAPQPIDQPLSSFWRQIRENQIEHGVRTRYGLADKAIILTGSPASRDLRRELHHLDDERMPLEQAHDQNENEIVRARTHFLPLIASTFEKSCKKTFGSIVDNGDMLVRAADTPEGDFDAELYTIIIEAAPTIVEELCVSPTEQRFILEEFSVTFLEELYRNNHKDSIQTVLDAALARVIGYMHDVFRFPANLEAAPLLHQLPMTYDYGYRKPSNGNWEDVLSDQASVSNRETLEAQLRQTAGWVKKYEPRGHQPSMRLIMADYDPTPPIHINGTVRSDLIVQFSPVGEQGKPRIPGYLLIGFDPQRNAFHYEKDGQGDPYVRCDVPLPDETRQALIKIYRELGLVKLAERLATERVMTVSELVTAIKASSHYHIPDELYETASWHKDGRRAVSTESKYIHSLTDFSESVVDGRLRVQCTGAARFVRGSLDLLFGAGKAGTVSGHTIDANDDRINAATHAQTVFNHAGRQYILDATPSGQVRSRIGFRSSFRRGDISGNAPRTPSIVQAVRQVATNLATFPEQIEPSREEQLASLTASLIEQFKVYFDSPNKDSLYTKLVSLPSHDPARRTMEMLVQYGNGSLDDAEIAKRINYISDCSYADQETLKQLGIGHYSDSFLSNLQTTAWRLEQIVKLSS